ncbi:hypothetical protein OG564_00975 [Streptomyces sp. NBC_01280]|uniref:hypothetical protein n=1 Tax=unclassified Streptomyces TaxID=2593676 RepID=UPI002E377415|nr:hypothetical protein [Streptomyces sp. NBC_01280]
MSLEAAGAVDGRAQILRRGHGRVPDAGPVELRSEDKCGTTARGDVVGEGVQPFGVGDLVVSIGVEVFRNDVLVPGDYLV